MSAPASLIGSCSKELSSEGSSMSLFSSRINKYSEPLSVVVRCDNNYPVTEMQPGLNPDQLRINLSYMTLSLFRYQQMQYNSRSISTCPLQTVHLFFRIRCPWNMISSAEMRCNHIDCNCSRFSGAQALELMLGFLGLEIPYMITDIE